MDKSISLTRTCTVCGLEKPLAAFLQVSGTQGTMYGSICATCRSSHAKVKAASLPQDLDESGSSSMGLTINAKTKLRDEVDKKEQAKKTAEENRQESKKRDEMDIEKTEKVSLKEKSEKEHRKSYLASNQTMDIPKSQNIHFHKKAASQKQQHEKDVVMDIQQKEEDTVQEKKLKEIDMKSIYTGSQFGELKFNSVPFQQFQRWLGGPAANRKTAEGAAQQKSNAQNPQKPATNKSESGKDPLIECIEKNWEPTSKRRK